MTREEAAHIVDVAFGVPQAVRRIGEDKTYHEDEIREAKDMAIKALEQEPKLRQALEQEKGAYNALVKNIQCADAINRQAVLDAFGLSEKTRKYGGDHSGYDTMMKYEIQDILESLPPVKQEPKWIPVSERLPKADEYVGNVAKYYLVQNEYGDMLVARYTHSGYWEQIYQLKPVADEIVAWMPLPESYKVESNETEQGLAYADEDTMMSAT